MHVMVQGVNKEYIFYKREYIEKYLSLIKDNQEKYNFTMLAYCIMNNHAHFLIYTEDINEFGNFMHKVNQTYAQIYNKKENRCGVIFRNRYKAEPIYDKKYLINCIKYIHNNPVKAKMVLKCEDYAYSSYKQYINNEGVAKNKIIKKIYGEKCDFESLFQNTFDRKFIDIDENETEFEYIMGGIGEYKRINNIKLEDIFSNKNYFKNLIIYLKKSWGIKYVDIRKFFEISRSTIDKLKIK